MIVNLSIIIVNWNGEKFLPVCIKSIIQNPPKCSFEIIVVDNASSDKSLEWFNSIEAETLLQETNSKLIESKENLGFGKANNLAIEQTNSPFVLLLNPDTIVKEQAIDKLLETLQSDKKIGAVAPRLIGEDGKLQPNVWSFPITASKILVEGLKLYHFIPTKMRGKWLYSYHWDYCQRTAVPMFSGAAIMAKREMISQVGGFNPDIHMFGEDSEWCIRISRNGWKLFFEPEAEVIHFGGLSSVQLWGNLNTRIKEEEALLRFQEYCLSPFQVFKNMLTKIFILYLYRLKRILKNQDNEYIDKVLCIQKRGFRTALSQIFAGSSK